ncbi:Cyclopropane-fatty-acyl-phospholipid synthase protein [Rutstroemia sp. NJR-2017a BVV2]|nr:Cyclopropane-fatty-acyl-phospholipid synthase protein [Rutstroemia sp. NJR-2017a BVV2]
MLAARDQENLVHGHQQVAASKPLNQSTRGLQPKTPGNKFPKTPLKVPLNDENAPTGFGGKGTIKGKGLGGKDATIDKNAFITPMGKCFRDISQLLANIYAKGPRNRAPLGMKTTNAKTKVFQTPAGPELDKEPEKTVSKQPSVRKPRSKVTEKIKIDVHGDESPLGELDVEYMPPRSQDIPFDSDVFPKGCLNYDVLKPENLTRGSLGAWYNTADRDGKSKVERDLEEGYRKSAKRTDELVLAAMEEEWTIGDMPETFKNPKKTAPLQQNKTKVFVEQRPKSTIPTQSRGPATVASRRAASALSTAPKSIAEPVKRPATAIARPVSSFLTRGKKTMIIAPAPQATMRHKAAAVTSRSTIGYTKGRSVSNPLQKREAPSTTLQKRVNPGLPRSNSNISQSSESTITPARFANKENFNVPEYKRPDFLRAFDVDDEDLEPGLRGALPECLKKFDEDEEEFVMTLGGVE